MSTNVDTEHGQKKHGGPPSPYINTPQPYIVTSTTTTSTTTTTATQQNSGDTGFRKYFDLAWIKTPLGRLKLAEWVGVIICLICNACTYVAPCTGAYWFATVVAESAIMWTLCLYLWKVYHRLPTQLTSNIMWFGLSAAGFVVFLAVSIGMFTGYPWDYGSSAATAAGVFGLVVCAMFLIETCYYLFRLRTHGRDARSGVDAMISEEVQAEQGDVSFFFCCF